MVEASQSKLEDAYFNCYPLLTKMSEKANFKTAVIRDKPSTDDEQTSESPISSKKIKTSEVCNIPRVCIQIADPLVKAEDYIKAEDDIKVESVIKTVDSSPNSNSNANLFDNSYNGNGDDGCFGMNADFMSLAKMMYHQNMLFTYMSNTFGMIHNTGLHY